MTSLLNYLYYLWGNKEISNIESDVYHSNENVESEYSIIDKKHLINKEDLEKVNLKSIVVGTSDKTLLVNKKSPLDIILSVKLRPTSVIIKPNYYVPKHPVLAELHRKFST